MRLALLLLAAGLCALSGYIAAESLRAQARILAALAESLARLRIEIGFSATTLNRATRRIASGEVEEFWLAFSDFLEMGYDAPEAWRIVQEEGLVNWGERCESIFADFVGGLGKSDRQNQCARIDETLLLLRREIEGAEQKARDSGKMRMSLGVIAGIALIIVLL